MHPKSESSPSVYEWGMGTSTKIAKFAEVKRLVSVDPDQANVDKMRTTFTSQDIPGWTFKHLDIGPTGAYGNPVKSSGSTEIITVPPT